MTIDYMHSSAERRGSLMAESLEAMRNTFELASTAGIEHFPKLPLLLKQTRTFLASAQRLNPELLGAIAEIRVLLRDIEKRSERIGRC